MGYFDEIIQRIIDGDISNPEELQKAKIKLCKKYGKAELPRNAEIFERVDRLDDVSREQVLHVLQRKPSRKKSGVTVVAVMTSPAECPHGSCIMCPGGPKKTVPSPQSYTGEEPAALRGARNGFDAKAQVEDRLRQYRAIGHSTDKVDLIVMGGTFPARDRDYQVDFVKGCFDGLNGTTAGTLEQAQDINETAHNRCIGMTVETRPDYCKKDNIDNMMHLGATRVEIGVQTLRDDILENIQRGHTVQDGVEATYHAKESGLKVCYHMMPGLPGSTPEEDLMDFENLFENGDFQPDMLKIYPTLVIKGTELYKMWKSGEYEPLTTLEAAELVARMKSIVPKYVRIQRVQRDIPSPIVDAGVKKSNLRQYAREKLKEMGDACSCIRCREVGHSDKEVDMNKVELNTIEYRASKGDEYFLEYGENDVIIAYARLRISEKIPPTIRELKVLGEMTPINEEGDDFQHRGFGKKLVNRCESIAGEYADEIRVTSGIGAREYYRKLNYSLNKPYMTKKLA